ncbi:lanosterol 14-alpha-demethylase [Gymnopus androsaceus JB14]|uniref:Lanosterol 14-alpha-demethylase n=1 Tax=Gymnopus androsaceus JB14 TaxID=1447944 RepID=A0A6A4HM53_9AGAR|nr:lanosterol 14-alpha-demethylase [Gymnopus androsaceus JB14]
MTPFSMNSTIPITVPDAWSGYLAQAQEISLTPTVILLALVNVPLLAIVLNVLRQLIVPHSKTAPPVVFHWIPIIGSAIEYGNDPMKFFVNCQAKYGNVFTFILLGRKVTVCLGAKGNNFILGGKSTVFNAEDAYTHLTTPVFGPDVVYDVPNEIFMEQKKFVKFGLSTDNFRAYVGMIEEEVEEFLSSDPAFSTYQMKETTEWGSFEAVKVLAEITILTASRTLQGTEVRENLNKSFAQIYTDLDGGFTPINFMFPNLPLESYRKRDRAQKQMSEFFAGFIKKRRTGGSGQHDHDMIAALLNQKYRSGKALKDHEIANIMIALLMAGQHTSSATGAWALLQLAERDDVADALYQEQVKHFGINGEPGKFRPLTYEDLRDLPVLDSVIRETLRVHPPIHSIMRAVRDDVPVPPTLAAPKSEGTYIVPKGHVVLASPFFAQMDPTVWKNANKWEPARWNDPEGVAMMALKEYTDEGGEKIDFGFGAVSKGTDSPYQPFGAGRHRCIGEQFAYLQLGTILSTFIRKMEFKIPTGVPEHNYHTMIVMPKTPRDIQYRRRHV